MGCWVWVDEVFECPGVACVADDEETEFGWEGEESLGLWWWWAVIVTVKMAVAVVFVFVDTPFCLPLLVVVVVVVDVDCSLCEISIIMGDESRLKKQRLVSTNAANHKSVLGPHVSGWCLS